MLAISSFQCLNLAMCGVTFSMDLLLYQVPGMPYLRQGETRVRAKVLLSVCVLEGGGVSYSYSYDKRVLLLLIIRGY